MGNESGHGGREFLCTSPALEFRHALSFTRIRLGRIADQR